MGSRWLSRLAVATAAAGAVALATASAAAAHETPLTGFDVVLHADHHNSVATDFQQKCEDIRKASPGLIEEGFDAWVFNIPNGQFDTADDVTTLRVTFKNLADETVVVEVPGTEFEWWIGPAANKHLVAISVPAGWTLVDGDANVVGSTSDWFVVTHTCAGVPESPPTTPSSPPPTSNGNGGGNGGTTPGGGGGGLPVTGPPVSAIFLAGIGLLAAGMALMAVRRRRDITDLNES